MRFENTVWMLSASGDLSYHNGLPCHLNSIHQNIYQILQPERIDPSGNPSNYDVRSDVWSFGISMIEISTGRFPYRTWASPFEQLKQVVMEEAPKLPSDCFSKEYVDFITQT